MSHVLEACSSIGEWFDFCNHRRLHQALGDHTPAEVYGQLEAAAAARIA